MCGFDQEPASNPTIKKCSIETKSEAVINLDHGDPTVYRSFWERMDDECTMVIKGSDSMSYISDIRNVCWFMEPELEAAVKRLHRTVGNAVVDDRNIVVGNGSTQIYHALLYALTSPGGEEPVSVVSAAPYYSQYVEETDYLRSGLFKWGGDARTFGKGKPCIEIVTSPNNPDGSIREAEAKDQNGGKIIYDLAYYWPQYTPITRPADYDIMYFTFSKSTGHAGSRIGWAIVKDEEIARKMTKFIELSSIGVSKDSQLRAAKIMGVICDGYKDLKSHKENFFEHAHLIMAERWKKLREVVKRRGVFSLPDYPREYCLFHAEFTESYPAFAWLKCKEGIEDCEKLLIENKIVGRGGKRFGGDEKCARLSMLSKDEVFEQFLLRLQNIKGVSNGH
ncbi:hypothetical protein UlMin_040235 [Ulmus minor]